MKKTGKYKKHGNIRKTRKHNSKLIGGYCCKYEDGVECNYGILSKQADIKNKSRTTQIQLKLKDGHDLNVHYQNHTFKHMEDMDLTCYDTDTLNIFLTKYIPNMHIFKNTKWKEQLDTTKEEILYDEHTKWDDSIINKNFCTKILPLQDPDYTYCGFSKLDDETTNNSKYFCILFKKHHHTRNVIVVYAIYLHEIKFHREGHVIQNKRIYINKYNDIYSQILNQIDEKFNTIFGKNINNINEYIQKIENAVTEAPDIIINSQRESEFISTYARNQETSYINYQYRGAINKKIDNSTIKKIKSSIVIIDVCNEFINKHSKRVNETLIPSKVVIKEAKKFVIYLNNLKNALKNEIDKVIKPYISNPLPQQDKLNLDRNRTKITNLLHTYLSQHTKFVSKQEDILKTKYEEIKYALNQYNNYIDEMKDKNEEMKSKITDSIRNPSSYAIQSHTGV